MPKKRKKHFNTRDSFDPEEVLDLIRRFTDDQPGAVKELSHEEAVRLLEEASHLIFRLRDMRKAEKQMVEKLKVLTDANDKMW